MNCKKCGMQLVTGQIICSNCGEENYENNQLNNYTNINNNPINNINAFDNDIKEKKLNGAKQNVLLKISSIFALIAGVAMIVSCMGTLSIKARLGTLGFMDLFQIVIAVVMILNAFFISNFNLGKNNFFDNRVIFMIFLCVDFIAGLFLRIYFVVFILSLIGFIISLKNKND